MRNAANLEGMDSLSFTPGKAYLGSLSPTPPWAVVFEDEGVAAYLYAWDHSQQDEEARVLDAMLIYNVSAAEARERLASIQWSSDGLRAVLYLDGTAQALVDFSARRSYSRMDFPNFVDGPSDRWLQSSHAWNQAALDEFERELYSLAN